MVDARPLVEREAELSELHGDGAVDARLLDALDRLAVLVDGGPYLRRIRHAFAEKVEDPSDPASVQLLDGLNRVFEIRPRDESLDDVPRETSFLDELLEARLLRRP
jgi:hypothetical protein